MTVTTMELWLLGSGNQPEGPRNAHLGLPIQITAQDAEKPEIIGQLDLGSLREAMVVWDTLGVLWVKRGQEHYARPFCMRTHVTRTPSWNLLLCYVWG